MWLNVGDSIEIRLIHMHEVSKNFFFTNATFSPHQLTVILKCLVVLKIRESVAQEVRQEIYSELLASVSPRQPPLPPKQ